MSDIVEGKEAYLLWLCHLKLQAKPPLVATFGLGHGGGLNDLEFRVLKSLSYLRAYVLVGIGRLFGKITPRGPMLEDTRKKAKQFPGIRWYWSAYAHAKMVVLDSEVFIGSQNISHGISWQELGIRVKDPAVVAACRKVWLDWPKESL